MSTRWYPLYQKGNPQLRVFLPNFWLKLVKPEHKQPDNVVQFHCSMEMTRFDVRNYLEKIYNVYPVKVNTRIAFGKTKKCELGNYVIKDDDIKIAYVTLPKDQKFVYPTLFDKKEDMIRLEEQLEEMKEKTKQYVKENKMPSFPNWFTV
ncbi:mitochondrial ribosomal protein L23 isoform X2 [Ptiloglossa arizonensis]|uniref:mitochondrial ribosomal protein L23 isoform X2 n=1 Tax=Ptiloglossa arizonensis TaxID=3350558 RepID=UPI003FA0DFC0